jgi:hypothetical protein
MPAAIWLQLLLILIRKHERILEHENAVSECISVFKLEFLHSLREIIQRLLWFYRSRSVKIVSG